MNKISELKTFDVVDYLDSEQAIAEYLQCVLEENDLNTLLLALGDIARARGMSAIAQDCGLGRESLYKALRADANPRYETISKVIQALGLQLTVTPIQH